LNDRPPDKTLAAALWDLKAAWLDLVLEVAHSIGIPRFCDWLAALLRRFTP
jgi:hypothetical protein